MHPSWKEALQEELAQPYVRTLFDFVAEERKKGVVYPPSGEVFTAYKVTPLDKVKVVILGQDPYHDEGQAHGLSFSVKPGVPHPPSLCNIFKELQSDLGVSPPEHGTLLKWAEQGVFLLNTVLTVRAHSAYSHRDRGWEAFTDRTVRILSDQPPMVFILWGGWARKKIIRVDTTKHVVLESPHPSPLSAHHGFFGSKPFSKANEALARLGRDPIDWSL